MTAAGKRTYTLREVYEILETAYALSRGDEVAKAESFLRLQLLKVWQEFTADERKTLVGPDEWEVWLA